MSDDVAAKLAAAAQSPELARLMKRSPTRWTWSFFALFLCTISLVGGVGALWWLILFELHRSRIFLGSMNALLTIGTVLAVWVVSRHLFKPLERVVVMVEGRRFEPYRRQRWERWHISFRSADGRTFSAECLNERVMQKCIVNHVGLAYLLFERLIEFERLD